MVKANVSPVEGLWPLHVQHHRKGGDNLKVSNDDLESHDKGVFPLLHKLKQPAETPRRQYRLIGLLPYRVVFVL